MGEKVWEKGGVEGQPGSRSYAVLTAATPQLIEFSC